MMDAERSLLMVIDVQARLLPAISDAGRVLANCVWLVRVAQELGVPVVVTEQYPQGLGPTVPALRELVSEDAIVAKVHFSCVAEGCLADLPSYTRDQVIVAGTEAHVCVLQTAMGLLEAGKQVYVVADAVGSRDPANRDLALERLRQNGAQIVAREMVAFEWLKRAGTDLFRRVNREYLR